MQFCTHCGNKVGKADKFCTHCGNPIIRMEPKNTTSSNENTFFNEAPSSSAPNFSPQKHNEAINHEHINQKLSNISGRAKQFAQTASVSQTESTLLYICIVLSVMEGLLPFFPWIKVPILDSISNFFLGNNNITKLSLFTAIMADSSGNTVSTIIVLLLSISAIIAIVFCILFIIKGLKGSGNYYKYGTMASIFMIVISLIFLLIFGLAASLFMGIIEITLSPWLELIGSIANIILIKKLKAKERTTI